MGFSPCSLPRPSRQVFSLFCSKRSISLPKFGVLKKLLFFVIFLGLGLFVSAQDSDKKDLKIGLVLSGGGAKGLAHIGALKVIEEAGIKIDYIGGTSMGAFVGALYAAGYTATELDSIFRTTDFTNLIEDNLPRSAKTFYEKEDSEKYAITLPFNKFKISVPPAFSGGQNVYNELVKLLYPVKNIEEFDKLPIPFLCMATDVETGEEVVLKEGYLPQAVMASGALPSLFEPVKIGDRLLIDGGVVNNYPIQKVKEMGADVIIGVDVQHGLRDRDGLISATEILLQINNYRTVLDMEEKSKLTDIYIKPDVSNFSVIDFNLYDRIIESGTEAAKKSYGDLRRLAIKQNDSERKMAKIKPQEKLIIDNLTVTGSADYSRGATRHGQVIDYQLFLGFDFGHLSFAIVLFYGKSSKIAIAFFSRFGTTLYDPVVEIKIDDRKIGYVGLDIDIGQFRFFFHIENGPVIVDLQ